MKSRTTAWAVEPTDCTQAAHAALKLDPASWNAATEPGGTWALAGTVLVLGHCRRCHSTLGRRLFPGEALIDAAGSQAA